MALLAILHPDVRAAARLSDALGDVHDILLHRSWESLEKTLGAEAIDACLIDADHPDRDGAARRLMQLRKQFPGLALVACVDHEQAAHYFGLGSLGVDGFLVSGSQTVKLRADLDIALSTARGQQIGRHLTTRMPDPGPAALAWAVEHAGPDASVERFSAALGHSPRSLGDALRAVGLPSPSRVLLWGRLLLAGARLGTDRRTVEDVALSLGYSASTSLARAMKRHTGLTPAEVSRQGGMNAVREAFLSTNPRDGDGPRHPRHRATQVATLVWSLALGGCATLGFGGAVVDRHSIEQVLASPPIDQIHVGIFAIDARTGRTLYAHNAKRKFVPASNQKLLVTATALSLLGPGYRFRTEVWATGSADGSYLEGDLVVVASGDPSMSSRYWESGTAALDAIADSLLQAGVEYVAGSTFIDVSAWDSTTVGPTWEVEDLRYAYGSTGGAFAIDEGEVEVIVTAGPAVGSPATIGWSPLGTEDFVRSRIRTSPPDSSTRVVPGYLPESRQLVLEGTIEWGTVDTMTFAMRDPVRQAAAALSRSIERAGIEMEGGWEIKWTKGERVGRGCLSGAVHECASSALLTVFESPPLSELIAGILKPSQNWMTEQLVRALGARYGAEGSWSEGVGVVEAYLVNEVGVDSLDISLRDGSGLSAYNLVTPRALVRILQEMHSGPYAAEYRSALAEPGEEGSTLEGRLLELEGRLFAKTGTISNVNSLSGYLVRDDGQEVIFSILTNGSGLPSSRVREAIHEIVRALAR